MEVEALMKKSAITQFIYLTVYLLLCVLEIYLMPNSLLTVLGIIGGGYLFIHTFFIKCNKKWLFANGLLSAFIVLQLSLLLAKDTKLEEFITLGIAICLVDVLSFTKIGKYTVNAQAISHVNIMSKLIVYGKGANDELYPTCGIGDYFYYALWITGLSLFTDQIIYFIIGIILLMIGSVINTFIIYKNYKKENYKGLPATIIPFICITIEYGLLYFQK